jgi:hypothetical protein
MSGRLAALRIADALLDRYLAIHLAGFLAYA